MITPISREAAVQLRTAEGWVELKSPDEALIELEQIPAQERSHPLVLEMFWRVYVEWEKWKPAFEAASELVERHPNLAAGWIDRAYALRRMKGGSISAAFEALLPALKQFPEEPVIPYNLACYCAQMERLAEARDWLEQALAIGDRERIHHMALNDPDLEPLRALGYIK